MATKFNGWAVHEKGQALKPFSFNPGPLGAEDVELRVESCGICHSDISMVDNEWGLSTYPLVPGHEVIGVIEAAGPAVKGVKVGDRVGVGWFTESCMHCSTCLSGDHNMCGSSKATIVGRHGGFADRLRTHWSWAVPLPPSLDPMAAGPLFCGGITVFNPIVQLAIKPTDRVGVVGIGGLGHLALQFLNKWGCEVTAFTSTAAKADEAQNMGAHYVVSSNDPSGLQSIAGSLDFILVTVNVPLDWSSFVNALTPRGKIHFVGGLLEPVPVSIFALLGGQKSVSASPLGSPATLRKMLTFCARHKLAPVTEVFPMSQVNEAIDHLRHGKARYRVVLDAGR